MVKVYKQDGTYEEFSEDDVEVITITANNILKIENYKTGIRFHFKDGSVKYLDNSKTEDGVNFIINSRDFSNEKAELPHKSLKNESKLASEDKTNELIFKEVENFKNKHKDFIEGYNEFLPKFEKFQKDYEMFLESFKKYETLIIKK